MLHGNFNPFKWQCACCNPPRQIYRRFSPVSADFDVYYHENDHTVAIPKGEQ